MLQKIKQLDAFLDAHSAALVIAAVALIARIPNLNEPYWYGDEAIYLTLGQALNKGYTLYSQIIDHKTPIIYFLAKVGTQVNFRMLNMAWNTVSIILFYTLTFRLFRRRTWATIATLLFALLTTMPWFEGNIPNGELFVIGFVLAGATILGKTQFWQSYFSESAPSIITNSKSTSNRERLLLILSGSIFSLAILTKIPAIFDLAAFLVIGFFKFIDDISRMTFSRVKALAKYTRPLMLIMAGVLIPIVLSVVYFKIQGAGKDYLDFGLLYNFRYAGTWNLNIAHPILAFMFTLPGKIGLLTLFIGLLAVLNRHISRVAQFSFAWFGLTLVACLLSNRPYSHYFIQLAAPVALIFTIALQQISNLIKPPKHKSVSTDNFSLVTVVISGICISLIIWILIFLKVSIYPAIPYYQRWLSFAQGKISQDQYRQSFEGLMRDNYAFAEILKAEKQDKLFVWGTNPGIYALSNTTPTGRFTASFHIKDFNAYEETFRDLSQDAPEYIVMMNNETTRFPQLEAYLTEFYKPTWQKYELYTVWKRKPATSP